MKKKFNLTDLDCANCAAKMEEAAKKVEGVRDVSVSFMTQKMVVEAEDEHFETVMKKIVKICRKIEPDCTIVM